MKKTLLSLQVFLHFFRYCLLFISTSLLAQQPTKTTAMDISGNSQFYKTNDANPDIEKHLVWINLRNTQGSFKQILIGYITGATNAWDLNYDGLALDGNKYVDFYSINDNKKLAIQGRALPFNDSDIIQLGYRAAVAGDLTISMDHAEGDLATHAIYLEDRTTGRKQNLQAGNYTFSTGVGTFTDRFIVSYGKSLGTHDFESIKSNVVVSVKDKIISLASIPDTESINEVVIYDISGKVLYNEKEIGSNALEISNIQSANQILLVKTTLENDYTSTTKIMF